MTLYKLYCWGILLHCSGSGCIGEMTISLTLKSHPNFPNSNFFRPTLLSYQPQKYSFHIAVRINLFPFVFAITCSFGSFYVFCFVLFCFGFVFCFLFLSVWYPKENISIYNYYYYRSVVDDIKICSFSLWTNGC